MEAWVVGLAAGYLIGSIPIGLWVARYGCGIDLRSGGSGKIGTTNALRRLGLKWSIPIFAGDVGKGVLPVVIVMVAFDSPTAEVLAALAALIGHIYPLYAGFRGGRAAATGFGALLTLTPLAAGIALATGVVLLAGTRIMSLTVLLCLTIAASVQGLLIAYGDVPDAYYGFVVGAWLIIGWAHRDNIDRLRHGRERVLGRPAPEPDRPPLGAREAAGP